MSIPECFERLLSNPMVGSGVHQEHEQKHEVSSDTTSLGVMDLKRDLRSHLYPFNVEKATNVSTEPHIVRRNTHLT